MLKNKLLLIICLLLFLIPFFWLKPGQMDLGGDSSRLYFYDPIHYLLSYPLYAIGPDGVGNEMIGYSLIPFVSFLAIIKLFILSPYLLITLFNSISLVTAFLSIQKIIVALLPEKTEKSHAYKASILAGIVYIFSPLTTNAGWDKAMYVHNQLFLNPLLFLLLLLFLKKNNIFYLFLFLVLSFIFSPNFSPSPYLFSFYLFAIPFLLIYSLWIRKYIPLKKIILGGFLYILLHIYYLFPFISNMFSTTSSVNSAVFSDQGKFVRGLSAFIGDVGNVSLAHNLVGSILSLPGVISSLFIIPFIIVIIGFFYAINEKIYVQKKVYLLVISFYLITLFFVTAHITETGLFIYKLFFQIPGFSIFRHFYGQFSSVYIFFYSLLLGLSFYYIIHGIAFKKNYLLFSVTAGVFIIAAIPFIRGDMIQAVLNPGAKKQVKVPIFIDHNYVSALSYIREQPYDVKYMQFPLTDAGYEMFAGVEGNGVYQGPSSIAYLTEKNEFVGYEGYGLSFRDQVLDLFQKKDFVPLEKLFSLLNIHYLFYNSDPTIYDDFPHFPYDYVRQFLPKDQKGYEKLLSNMQLKKIKDFGTKYHLYELPNNTTHLSVSSAPAFTNDTSKLLDILQLPISSESAVASIDSYKDFGDIFLFGSSSYPFAFFSNNSHLHVHQPYVSRRLTSKGYPLSVFAEKNDLKSRENSLTDFTDLSFFYATKRIVELEQWGAEIPITHRPWNSPSFLQIPFTNYNSWEASLTRYQNLIESVIKKTSSADRLTKEETDIKINEQLDQHQLRLIRVIRSSSFSNENKTYLRKRIDSIFQNLRKEINIPIPMTNTYTFNTSYAPSGSYVAYSYMNPTTVQKLGSISLESGKKITYSISDVKPIPIDYLREQVIPGQQSYTLPISLQPGNEYSMSLHYKTDGKDITLKLADTIKDDKGKNSIHTYFEKNLNEKNLTQKNIIFTIDNSSSHLTLSFTNETDSPVPLTLENILIKSAVLPTLVLVKTSPNITKSLPQIAFQKINPTKYKVYVSDAQSPYFLQFLEAFNPKWKVYLSPDEPYDTSRVIRSVNNGQIKELQHQNIFLGRSTFETLRGKSISLTTHFMTDNYANTWDITPVMVGNKKSYVLILEFETQEYFYILFGISLITFIAIIVFSLYQFRRK